MARSFFAASPIEETGICLGSHQIFAAQATGLQAAMDADDDVFQLFLKLCEEAFRGEWPTHPSTRQVPTNAIPGPSRG